MDKSRQFHPLTRAHLAAGLSLDDFAEKVGVTTNSVINWKKGHKLPRLEQLQKMADVLGKSREDVLEMIAPTVGAGK